jgi:hypothetical protein
VPDSYIYDTIDGMIRIKIDNRYNFMNLKGEWISKEWFSYATDYDGGFAIIEHKGCKCRINKMGKIEYLRTA